MIASETWHRRYPKKLWLGMILHFNAVSYNILASSLVTFSDALMENFKLLFRFL